VQLRSNRSARILIVYVGVRREEASHDKDTLQRDFSISLIMKSTTMLDPDWIVRCRGLFWEDEIQGHVWARAVARSRAGVGIVWC
jgi:hypothetical protein